MPWWVNTTHTMGVDVIDKTVGRGGGGGSASTDTKSLDWRGQAVTPFIKTLELLVKLYWHQRMCTEDESLSMQLSSLPFVFSFLR